MLWCIPDLKDNDGMHAFKLLKAQKKSPPFGGLSTVLKHSRT